MSVTADKCRPPPIDTAHVSAEKSKDASHKRTSTQMGWASAQNTKAASVKSPSSKAQYSISGYFVVLSNLSAAFDAAQFDLDNSQPRERKRKMANNISNYSLQNSNSGNQSTTSIYNTGSFKNVTYYNAKSKSYSDEGARWKLLSAAVGIISAVIIAFGPALIKDDAVAAENSKPTTTRTQSESPTSDETTPTATTSDPSETDSEETAGPVDEPTPDVTNTALNNPETYKPDNIAVKVHDTGFYNGKKIGPNKFQIEGSALTLYYHWEAKHRGSVIESDNCEMITTVSGPDGFSGNKTSKCSISSSRPEELKFTAPGDYTITVTDRQSNVSGELKISVLQ